MLRRISARWADPRWSRNKIELPGDDVLEMEREILGAMADLSIDDQVVITNELQWLWRTNALAEGEESIKVSGTVPFEAIFSDLEKRCKERASINVNVLITPQATEDLREIESCIGSEDPKASLDFVYKINEITKKDIQSLVMSSTPRDEIKSGFSSHRFDCIRYGATKGNLHFFCMQTSDALILQRVIHESRV